MSKVPYAQASSGTAARDEVERILQRFGCTKIGWMNEYEKHAVILYFEHRGRQVQLRASAEGWAAMYLREEPWSNRRSLDKAAYHHKALLQGMVAVNSILRDWVKGMVTAIECGMFDFDTGFLPHMITKDGRTVAEVVLDPESAVKLLPPPEGG